MSRSIDIGNVVAARTPWSRLRGLMGRRGLAGVKVWFPRCSSVHTFFMREAIDVVFLDKERTVVTLYSEVPPWRVCWGGARADSVLELGPGDARKREVAKGDRIEWQD